MKIFVRLTMSAHRDVNFGNSRELISLGNSDRAFEIETDDLEKIGKVINVVGKASEDLEHMGAKQR